MKKMRVRGMLGRSYGLTQTNGKRIASPYVHLGVAGAGLVLGYVSFPYRETPLGSVLLGAGGSILAVGILLLAYDFLKDKRVVQI